MTDEHNTVPEIVLETTPTVKEEVVAVVEQKFDAPDVKYLEDNNLTPAELQMVADFVDQIDLTDTNVVLSYGAASQKKIAAFSNDALESVKTKDMGEVGGMITNLVAELKGFNAEEEKKGLLAFFKKKANAIEKLKSQYDSAELNVEKISAALEGHQNQLTKDIVMLDKMYDTNLTYFKELTMYIMAGKQKLEQEKAGTLAELQKRAAESGLAEDAQAARDYSDTLERFEKKLMDLELTRTVSIQMAPQIRLIQSGDTLMVDKIQSTLVNTIPLWKNQMVLALGLSHSQDAMQAQQAVNDLTNQLLLQNAETLKTGSVAIAKESEKTIIDIETVKTTNQKLIETLEETLQIQQDGRVKRAQAEQELAVIEANMKAKLLEMSRQTNENAQ